MLRLTPRGFALNSQFIRILNHLDKNYAQDFKWTVADQDWPKFFGLDKLMFRYMDYLSL